MGKFEKKVVIITGASSGIGEAVAVAFAKEGAKIVISGRNKERLGETSKQCKAAGAEVLEVIIDLAKFEGIEPLVNKTVEQFGGIDIVINNAGYAFASPIEQLDCKAYDDLFNTNVRAPVFLCKYAAPHLKKSKGCVVNVSSCAAMKIPQMVVPYCMTKAALDHFTRGFSAEMAAAGVRVNSVNPAYVKTRFSDRLGVPEAVKDQMLKKVVDSQPFGFLTPSHISDAILFLCSSPMITGVSLPVDAGYLNNS